MFGATGPSLVRASIAAGAERTTPEAVTSDLNGYMPAAP
jgi:hypothetical protein